MGLQKNEKVCIFKQKSTKAHKQHSPFVALPLFA